MPKRRSPGKWYVRLLPPVLLIPCSIFFAYYLLSFTVLFQPIAQDQSNLVVKTFGDENVLSREKLAIATAQQPNTTKERFIEIVGPPAGQLGDLKSKELGLVAQYYYPLAFDPANDYVALFKDDKLVGYRWLFNRRPFN